VRDCEIYSNASHRLTVVLLILIAVALIVWDTGDNRWRLMSLFGLFVLVFVAWLLSKHPLQVGV
jgi:lipopolysaccharide export LptBFGC system permease protein LptF